MHKPLMSGRSLNFSQKPNVVVIDKTVKTAASIQVAVPNDNKTHCKEYKKVEKYQDLWLEVQRPWNVKAPVTPVMLRALRSTTPYFPDHLEKIPDRHTSAALVKEALLSSSHTSPKPWRCQI